MPESGDYEPGFDVAGDTCSIVISTESEEISGGTEEEEQADRLEEGLKSLLTGAWGNVTGAVGFFGLSCCGRGALSDEEAGDVIDGVAIDERLEEV